MNKDIHTFSDLAESVLGRHGLNRQVSAATEVSKIQKAIDEKTAGTAWRIEAISLKDGRLKISVPVGNMKPIAINIAKTVVSELGKEAEITEIQCILDVPNRDKML